MSVAQFAENLVEDFYIPQNVSSNIASIISDQIKEFNAHPFIDTSKLRNTDTERDEDMRITIKLDITVGQHNLVDQFEWDINCPDNNPEKFAEVLCKELNLSGEFATAIAHSIREQQQVYTKSLVLIGHEFDGTPVEDEDIKKEFLPVVSSDILRAKNHIKDYSPSLFEVDDSELDRQDRDRDRESRRKRRQGRAGRRGGPALPDFKDLVKTFRTPIFSSMLPGAVDYNDELMRQLNGDSDDDDDDDDDDDEVVGASTRRSRAALNHHHHNGHAKTNSPALVINSSSNRSASWRNQQSERTISSVKPTPQPSPLQQVTSQTFQPVSKMEQPQIQPQLQPSLQQNIPKDDEGTSIRTNDIRDAEEKDSFIVKLRIPKLKASFTK